LLIIWIALLGTGMMCQLQSFLEKAGEVRAFVHQLYRTQVLCLAVARDAWELTRIYGQSAIMTTNHSTLSCAVRHSALSLIALAMRYTLYIE